jgi:hypothetical protein
VPASSRINVPSNHNVQLFRDIEEAVTQFQQEATPAIPAEEIKQLHMEGKQEKLAAE